MHLTVPAGKARKSLNRGNKLQYHFQFLLLTLNIPAKKCECFSKKTCDFQATDMTDRSLD
jgi:hypothetical protein